MNLLELPPAVLNLATLGESWEKPAQWKDYRALGIGPEHIPALISIVDHAEDFWDGDSDPESWLPIHAWRALGQLQAGEAVPALVRTLPWIDENDNDIIQEDIPDVLGMIGPAAVPALVDFLENAKKPLWARIAAAEGLKNVGMLYPETRQVIIEVLLRALANYPKNRYALNSFLIVYLSYLKTSEGAPLVEKVFESGRVDAEITGDWEDYQVAVGLLEGRLTPRRPGHRSPIAFSDGLPEPALPIPLVKALGAVPVDFPKVEKKKNKKPLLQSKHAAAQDEKPNKTSGKHKRKDAKPKHKKGKKK